MEGRCYRGQRRVNEKDTDETAVQGDVPPVMGGLQIVGRMGILVPESLARHSRVISSIGLFSEEVGEGGKQ